MSNKTQERKMLRTDWKELPIDNELSQIILQIANARASLLNFHESIPDRKSYDSYEAGVSAAAVHLLSAMMAIGDDLMTQDFVSKLIGEK